MSTSAPLPNPPRTIHPSTRADYVQPTLGHALRIWWAFYWRTSAVTIVLVALSTAALRFMYQSRGISFDTFVWGTKLAPYVFYYCAAIPVMRFVLHKRFRQFRVVLWSQAGEPPSETEKPFYGRVIRVWWAFCWRAALYSVIGTVVAGFPLRFVVALFAPTPKVSALFEMVLATMVGAAMGLYVIYSTILDENMADFRVGLLAVEASETSASQAVPTSAA